MREVRKGMLLVISGPSGVGKGTLFKKLLKDDPSTTFSVSYTTRAPRPGEVNGADYHFVTREAYNAMKEKGGFLESAEVHGNCYGTPVQPVLEAIEKGLNMVLDIDPQGALQVMAAMPGCVSVFILPPSYPQLRQRLTDRNTESPEDVERRLGNARGEIALMDRYQYLIVNDDLEKAYAQLKGIVDAEKQRSVRYFPVVEE